MNKAACGYFVPVLVLAFMAVFMRPVFALEEINYQHLKAAPQDILDIDGGDFIAGIVPNGARFGNISIGFDLELTAAGVLRFGASPGQILTTRYRHSSGRLMSRLISLGLGETIAASSLGRGDIAVLLERDVCEVGFQVTMHYDPSQRAQLPTPERAKILVTAFDRQGEVVGRYLRHPARGTTRQAFAVEPGKGPIAGLIFSSDAPGGYGLASIRVKPCVFLMM